jgi:hypothetical protein
MFPSPANHASCKFRDESPSQRFVGGSIIEFAHAGSNPSVYLILHTTSPKSCIGLDLLAKISEMRVDGGLPNVQKPDTFTSPLL